MSLTKWAKNAIAKAVEGTGHPVEQLIAGVRKQAAEKPDRVYIAPTTAGGGRASCLYVHNGSGSCIVGCAAIDAGLIDNPAEFEHLNTNTQAVSGLLGLLGVAYTPEQIKWLQCAQDAQDNGDSWAAAVARADAFLATHTYNDGIWEENE